LSRNLVGSVADDDDFGEEIQDIVDIPTNVPRKEEGLLCVKAEEDTKWISVRRKGRQHDASCSGSNHWICVSNHQLYMLDVAAAKDLYEEFIPGEKPMSTGDELEQREGARVALKRRMPQYFDKR